MSNLVPFNPLRDLMDFRQAMDQLFHNMVSQSIFGDFWGTPLVDVYQTDKDVVVKAAIPGIDPKDIDVSITGNTLSLRGQIEQEEESKHATYHLRERQFGSFERLITLPARVNADKAKATYKNGVLTLTIPKAEEVQTRKIEIKVK